MTARDLDVLTAGGIPVDFAAPQAADLPVADEFLRTGGGAPAIVAAAVARLGGRSAFAGAVGADPFGEFLRRVLEAHGVLLHALRTVPERTSLAFVARNRGGIPDFVFYRDADFVIRPEDLPPDLVRQATFLHLSSLALM